jgi:hypothetical protein
MASSTFSIQCDNSMYWSSTPTIAINGTQTLLLNESKEQFTMGTINGGNGRSVYFISQTTNMYLQWNANYDGTASIINSSYSGNTEWSQIPSSNQPALTFYYTSIPLENKFRIQTNNKDGLYLKRMNLIISGGSPVNYIQAFSQLDDFGKFYKIAGSLKNA